MATDLLYVLLLSMGDNLGNEDGKDVFEELQGKRHAGPVMTLFHDIKNVTYCENVGG